MILIHLNSGFSVSLGSLRTSTSLGGLGSYGALEDLRGLEASGAWGASEASGTLGLDWEGSYAP